MALKLTAESYLQVVRQSGLIDKEQLSKLLQAYANRGVDVKKSQDIADAMIADERLTRWQAEKLLAGRHKGFFLGKYRLLDLLGKGGMSSVYLAEHVLMKRRCAIKVLPSKRVHDSSYLARFHREAQAVASVDHPNIVRAYDVDSAQDRDNQIHFLVMEYVSGRSLQEIVNQDGPQEYVAATEFIRQAADGLQHAHKAGLVHRDIKPANLLVDNSGTVKILDMGLARFFDDRDENPLTVAHDEKVLGTADYLAPEQALDSHTVDTRADIYSLGCSLYFLLTGHPPFTEGTLAQRLMWHQTKVFPPITNERPDCPQPLLRILAKMVAKQPDDRQNSAAEVATACTQWLIENAGTEWKKRHPALLRAGTSSTKLPAPSSDPRTDSVVKTSTATDVTDASPVISQDLGGAAATKISKAGSAAKPGSGAKPAPSTKISEPLSSAVPAVAPTPVEIRVAPPVAQPLIAQTVVAPVAPPLAKPVIPVAAPVAAPVVPALPVAQPVVPSVPVAAPVVSASTASSSLPVTTAIVPVTDVEQTTPGSTVPVDFPDSASATFNFLENFTEQPVDTDALTVQFPASPDTTDDADIEPPLDPSAERDIFSWFGGGSDVQTVTQPDTAPLPDAAEPTSTTLPHSESDAVPLITNDDDLVSSTPAQQTSKFAKFTPTWKQPKVLAAVVGAFIVMIGLGVWLSGGWGPTPKSSTPKQKSSKSLANGTTGKAAAATTATFEVAIRVGPNGEFQSIGRALHSIQEDHLNYEAQAKGKPLRFVISLVTNQTYEESLVVDESFPGDLHLKAESGRRVKLTPSSNDPIITVKGHDGVTLENLFLDMGLGKEVAVLVSGSAARCHMKNLIVSGFGRAGIELDAAKGADGADGILIESVTFQNASPSASGIHFVNSAAPSQHVTLQRCRFVSTMAAAVFVEGPVESLIARNCGVAGATSGFRFASGAVVKNLLIENCSFLNVAEAGILFDDLPAGGSGELCWRNNLFAGMKKTELLIARNYDARKFDGLLSTENAVENNWSDRTAAQPVAGERDLILDRSQRVDKIEFAASPASSDGFLAPKAGAPYKSAGVKGKQ